MKSLSVASVLCVGTLLLGEVAVGASTTRVPHGGPQPISAVKVFSDSRFHWNTGMALAGTNLWIADEFDGNLVEVSTTSGAVVRSLPDLTFASPCGLAYDGTHLWVTSCHGSSVAEVDASSGSVMQTLAGGSYGFANPTAIVCSPSDCWVANANAPNESITEFSTSDGSWVRTISGPNFGFGFSDNILNLTLAGAALWVANSRLSSVDEIQTSTGDLVRQIVGSQYGLKYPQSVAVDGPDLWIVNGTTLAHNAIEVSTGSGALIRTIGAAQSDHGPPSTVYANGPHVWIGFWNQGVVEELSAASGLLLRTLAAPPNPKNYGFHGPWAMISDGTDLWVSNDDISGQLAEITAGWVTSTFRIAASPRTPTLGQRLTLMAVGLAPGATGSVRFASAGRLMCVAVVTVGSSKCTTAMRLSVGVHAVSATYSGDRNLAGSHASLRLSVRK